MPPLDKLPDIFKKYPQIRAVYLFGSVVSGRTHENSDLDLAILPRGRYSSHLKLDLLTDLGKHGFTDVDIVFLDTDDIVLKYEAIRHNYVIYHTEGFERGDLYSRIVRQYLDFRYYLDIQREAYKGRIISGQG